MADLCLDEIHSACFCSDHNPNFSVKVQNIFIMYATDGGVYYIIRASSDWMPSRYLFSNDRSEMSTKNGPIKIMILISLVHCILHSYTFKHSHSLYYFSHTSAFKIRNIVPWKVTVYSFLVILCLVSICLSLRKDI